MANEFQTRITADASGFNAAVSQATATMTAFGSKARSLSSSFSGAFGMMSRAVGALGVALSAGAIVSGLKSIADHIDNVGKVASRLGMTTEALSELQYAAKMNGSSADVMSTALQKLNVNLGLAASGAGTAKSAFDAMGIKIKDSNGIVKDATTIFYEVAERFSTYEDGANKVALANAIFGRSGIELVNTLNLGKAGLKSAANEAHRFGLVVDSQAAAAAAKFNDDLERLSGVVSKAGQSILKDLLPALTRLIERFVTALNASKGFWGFLQNFFSMSNSDFENPAKAVSGYEEKIKSLKSEFKALDEKLGTVNVGTEEYVDTLQRMGAIMLEIKNAQAAIAQLKPVIGTSMDNSVAQKTEKAAEQAKPKVQAPAMKPPKAAKSEKVAEKAAELRAIAKLEDAQAKYEISLIEDKINKQRAADELMVDIGLMSREQLLSKEQEYQTELYDEQKKALQSRLDLLSKDPTQNPEAKAKIQIQLLELEKKHNKEIIELDKKQTKERMKYVSQFYDSIQSGFQSVLTDFLNGSLTIQGLFRGLFDSILQAFIGMITKMAAQWMAQQIMNLVMSKTTAASEITSASAKAGAEGTASMAGAPWPLNMTAPAFGASMAAAAAAYSAGLASAAGGYDIPAGVNPLTQLHEKEMVLPASIAEPLRNSLSSKKQSQTVVHLSGVSAGKFFVAAKKDLVKALKGANRDFAFAS